MFRDIIAREHHAWADRRDLSCVFLRRTEREYAGDRRHDDHVPPLEQRGRCAVAQAVDLLVYRGILFNIYILSGDVRLGLIVVVIRHEEFDGVLGEERAEFGAELCGKGLVVGEHERRAVQPRDHVRHGEGLARAGDAEECLPRHSRFKPRAEQVDRLRLIARRGVR